MHTKTKCDPQGKKGGGFLMAGKRDRGETHVMVKWNPPLKEFKYVHVYSHCSTNHAKTIGLEGSSSSTTQGNNACPFIKRALEGLK